MIWIVEGKLAGLTWAALLNRGVFSSQEEAEENSQRNQDARMLYRVRRYIREDK